MQLYRAADLPVNHFGSSAALLLRAVLATQAERKSAGKRLFPERDVQRAGRVASGAALPKQKPR